MPHNVFFVSPCLRRSVTMWVRVRDGVSVRVNGENNVCIQQDIMSTVHLVSSFIGEHPLSSKGPKHVDTFRVVHNVVCMCLVWTRGCSPGKLTHAFCNQGLCLGDIIRKHMIEACPVPVRCRRGRSVGIGVWIGLWTLLNTLKNC